ncbi:ABC transporter permease [Phaeobacter sp. NW0010-22]|uniref:ABC transporter permease n=1 Tax=Phaeobacter sp. NW0010-22 TaxID=3135907 RepID=UPI003106744C
MKQIALLAVRDLFHSRVFLFCNTAIMVGVLVPLLLLFGVKNGIYSALIGEMLANPANLQIDTSGNATFSPEDVAQLSTWPEIAFFTPKVRGQFDYMNVRTKGGRRLKSAVVIPSGAGDPTLPLGLDLPEGQVAVSAQLARQLQISAQAEIELISQAEGRSKQLRLPMKVVTVLPEGAMSGRAVLLAFPTLDVIEAFYESYTLPTYGIEGARKLEDRVPSYEGVRVFAHRLEDLAALQSRLETTLGVRTLARTQEVNALLGLGQKLNLALGLTATLAAMGLGAALVFGFWSDVARKRQTLAAIALLGVPGRTLALFPMVQAGLTATFGLSLSLLLFLGAGKIADRLFGHGLPDGAVLAQISQGQAVSICFAVYGLVLTAAGAAAWSALRLDPATVLRETS